MKRATKKSLSHKRMIRQLAVGELSRFIGTGYVANKKQIYKHMK